MLTTITDRKVAIVHASVADSVGYFTADIASSCDYYPFGMQMPDRNFSPNEYRYAFNGMEKDDDVYSSSGTSYTAAFWQYDSRLGRRWNVDPVVKEHESPYACFANNPIWFIDVNGLDSTTYIYSELDKEGNPLYKPDELKKIAEAAEKLDRMNGIDYTKFKVYGTEKDLLKAQKDGEITLNPLTDLAFGFDGWDPDDTGFGTLHLGYTNNTAKNYGGVYLYSGVIHLGAIKSATRDGTEYLNAGKTLNHERLVHGYMFVLADIAGISPVKHFKPSWDLNLQPPTIANQAGGFKDYINTRSYTKLRSNETVEEKRKKHLKLLFYHAFFVKNNINFDTKSKIKNEIQRP